MLQKLSKSEVKADSVEIQLPSNSTCNQFWLHLNIKKCLFYNCRDFEIWILVDLGLDNCSNSLKSKFRTSNIAKNDNFWTSKTLEIDFTQNLRCGKIIKFQQSDALTSDFESFWSIVSWFLHTCNPISNVIVGNTHHYLAIGGSLIHLRPVNKRPPR